MLRGALLGTTAIVGVALAAPVAAQTAGAPAGGGTITTTAGTGSGGGANQGVLFQQTGAGGVTVNGVNITNTGITPTADGLRVVGDGSDGVGLGIQTSSTITSQTGDGLRLLSNGGENIAFGVTAGQTLNVTGVNGVHLTGNGGLFLNNVGDAGAIVATARTNGSGTGVLIAIGGGFGGSLGSVSASGFATGIGLTGNGVGVTVEGGTINATTTGISAVSTANIILSSQAAITAPTGINAQAQSGVSVTTSGGGTINSTASGTGTGIAVTNSGGANPVTVTVGASIGATTTFMTAIDARITGGTGTISITNNAGVLIQGAGSASTPVPGGINAVGALTLTNAGAIVSTVGNDIATSAGGTITNGNATFTTAQNAASRIEGKQTAISGNGSALLTVNNYGRIIGDDFGGTGQNNSGAFTLNNFATGVVAANGGFNGTFAFGAFAAGGGVLNVTNAGLITSKQYAVYGSNGADTVTNSGTIEGGVFNNDGTVTAGGVNAINLTAGGTVINNAVGVIVAGTNGISSAGALTLTNAATAKIVGGTDGVTVTGAIDVTNNGTIGSGTLSGTTYTAGGTYGILAGAGGTVRNVGTASVIQGGSGAGVYSSGTADFTLTNAGQIKTNSTGTVDAVTALGKITVTNTGTIAANSAGASGIAAVGANSSVTNSGTITGGSQATYGYGVQLQGATSSVINQTGGVINGAVGGIVARNNATGTVITNTGAIYGTGTTSYGVSVEAGSAAITNQTGGVIAGQSDGILSAGTITVSNAGTIGTGTVNGGGTFAVGGAGFAVQAASVAITNTGTLNSTGASINQTDTAGTLNLVNTGTIGGAGRAVDPDDTVVARGAATILNSGTITSPNFYAVSMLKGGSLTNAAGGVISAGTQDNDRYGVFVTNASGTINNYGTIRSTSTDQSRGIQTDNNAATINLYAGSTTGSILTGAGNDALTLYNGRGTAGTATTQGYTDAVSGAAATVTLQNAGTLTAAAVGGVNLGGGTNTLTLAGTGDGTAANGDVGTLNVASLTNVTKLVKQDAGTWTLTGTAGSGDFVNTGAGAGFVPAVQIVAGRLVESNTGAALGTGTVNIGSGATLELANTNAASASPSVAVGPSTFTGTGTIVKSGPGYSAFGGNGVVNISLSQGALIDVQGGLLQGSSTFQGIWTNNKAGLNVASGATFNGVEGTIFVDALTGSGTVLGGQGGVARTTTVGVANGSGTFAGTIGDYTSDPGSKLALTKAGTGTQTLSGANTYTGATTINGGILALSGGAALADTNVVTVTSPGTLQLLSSETIGNLLGSGGVTLGASTLTLGAATGSFSGAITGTGGLTVNGNGTYQLTGTGNTYSGTTTIGAGETLQGTTATLSANSAVVDNGTLAFVQAASGTYAPGVSGTGVVTVSGLSTGNAVTFSGALTDNAGVSILDASTVTIATTGSVIAGGNLAVQGAAGSTINNLGTISAVADGAAVDFGAGGTVVNGSTTNTTARISNNFTTILDNGGPLKVTNYGVLFSNGYTVVAQGGNTTNPSSLDLTNSGIIVGALNGTVANDATTASSVVNSGLIQIGSYNTTTGAVTASGGGTAVIFQNGGAATVTNNAGGRIVGGTSTAGGDNYGVKAAGTLTLVNGGSATVGGVTTRAGQIVGGYSGVEASGLATITNNGLIASGTVDNTNTGTTVTSGYTVGGQDGIRLLASGSVTNNAGAVIQGSAGAAIYAAGTTTATLTNSGTVSAANGFYTFGNNGQALSVTNNAGGLIQATAGTGVYQGGSGTLTVTNNAGAFIVSNVGTGDAVHDDGFGLVTINNGGTIVGTASGMAVNGMVDVTNTGLIGAGTLANGTSGAFTANGAYVGISTTSGGTIRNNGGSIRGGGGVGIVSNAALTLSNTGTISTAATALAGVNLTGATSKVSNSGGISGGAQAIVLNNGGSVFNSAAGTLSTTNTGALNDASGIYANGNLTLTNLGSISTANTGASYGVEVTSAGTSTIVNAGSISAASKAAVSTAGGTTQNAAAGLLQGGADVAQGYGIVQAGGTIQNYGTIKGSGGGNGLGISGGNNGLSIGLYAGSVTGSIATGSGNDLLNLYTGTVNAAVVTTQVTDPVSGAISNVTLQNAGSLAAAGFGAISLGSGTNAVNLRGAGADAAMGGMTGQQASLDLSAISGASTLTKRDTGTWVLSGAANGSTGGGAPATSAATIFAGTGAANTTGVGGEGILAFNGTTGLTGVIYVNGATVQVSGNGALGTGLIHMVDPNITFTSTSTQTNNIVLDVASPASNPSPGSNTTTDPSTFTANSGVVATLTGAITTGTGNNVNGKAIDANQPVVIAGAGTIVLTNAGNSWTGVTTINAGATLRGTTASLSGSSFVDNGTLNFNQAAAGTSARAISGGGSVLVDGGGNVSLTGAITATGGVRVGANSTATLSNVSGSNNTLVTLTGASATLNVASGGSLVATNGGAVFGTAQTGTVNNAGTVTSTGGFSGVYFNSGTGTGTVVNTGTITGSSAVYSLSVLNLTNNGTLTGQTSNAVFASGAGTSVVNNATITGVSTGTSLSSAVGLNAAGTITNNGGATISGNRGIAAGGTTGGTTVNNYGQITGVLDNAVSLFSGGSVTNYASGTLTATHAGGWGVFLAGGGTADNQGTINADSGLVSSTNAAVFTNEGTITAARNGVWGQATSVNLVNTGAITGGGAAGTAGVRAEGAGSSITNSGTITASSTAGVGVTMTGGTLTNQSGGVISGGMVAGGGFGTAIQLVGMGNILNLQAGSTVNGTIDASGTTDASNSYTFTGALNGGFTGGSGNDMVTLVTPVSVTGTLDGGAGTDTLVLDGTGTGSLGSAQVVNFENGIKQGSGSWTLTGTTAASPSAFSVLAGTLAVAGGNALGDTAAVTIASGATVQLNASETIGSLAGAGSVQLGANTLTTGGANASPTFSGVIAGSGGLTKVGTGTLTLSGANSYTGATMVNAGTLALGASNVLADASAVSVASGATFDLGANSDTVASLALAGTLAGTGTLTAATYTLNAGTVNANLGAGTLTQASGASTLNGQTATNTVNVNAGTLSLDASNRIVDTAAVSVASGATFDLGANSDTVASLALAGTLAGTGTLTAATYTLNAGTVNANLGAGTLTQASGASTLNGQTATNTVNVNAGTLSLDASNRIVDTAAVSVASGATFDLGANSDTVASLALAGTLAGTGTLTAATYTLNAGTVNANLGAGTLTQASGASTLNGQTATNAVNVNAGTLSLGASNRIVDTAAVSVASGATLNLATFSDTVATATLAGTLAGTGTLTAVTYTLNGAVVNGNLGTGVLTQASGASTLSGTSSAGTTNVNAGTLRLGASDRIADTSVVTIANGGTFDVAGYNETIGTLAGSGAVTLGAGTLTTGGNNVDTTFSGRVSGTGSLTKVGTGTLTLTGANTLTGAINAQAGTLALLGSTAGSLRVAGGTVIGTGQVAGNLAVSSGTLSVGTPSAAIGSLSAGSLTVTGGTSVFDFAGSTGGFTSDRINVAGAVNLTGGLVSARATEASANYRVMQTYTLIQAGSVAGTFANGGTFTASANNADLFYRLRYDLVPGSVLLEVRKQIDFTAGLGSGASGNQLAVGRAFNGSALGASDAYANVLNAIQALSPGDRAAAYDSISGEGIADISTSVGLMNQRFTELLRRRLSSAGGSTANGNLVAALVGGARGLANARAAGELGGELDATQSGTTSAFADGTGGEGTRGGAWVQSFGGYGLLRGQAGAANLFDQSYGIAGGLDARVGPVTLGIAGSGAGVDTRVAARATKGNGTIYQGAGYAAYDDGRLFASAIGTYFAGDVTSRRSVLVGAAQQGVASGRARTHGYGGSVSAGYRIDLGGGTTYTPQVSFEATHVKRDAFTETGVGVLNLAAASQRRTLYQADAEGRLSHRFDLGGGGTIDPYVGGGINANWGDRMALNTMQITGAPAGTGAFVIDGAHLARYTGLITGGIDGHPSDRVTLGVGLQAHRSPRQKDGAVQIHAKIAF